jgi:hypothetical protein
MRLAAVDEATSNRQNLLDTFVKIARYLREIFVCKYWSGVVIKALRY